MRNWRSVLSQLEMQFPLYIVEYIVLLMVYITHNQR